MNNFKIILTKYVGLVKKKVINYNKAFNYLRYKKVFLDENLKTWFSDMKKLKKPKNNKLFSKTISEL